MGGFSALAGGFALGIIMIPLVTRTTEEMVKLVPSELREEAALEPDQSTGNSQRYHQDANQRRDGVRTGHDACTILLQTGS
jgi:hypothetical protein